MPESSIIPHFPNIPPSKEEYFHKESLVEILSGMQTQFHHVIAILPNNLQIIPHTYTEITLEKEMVSVLKCPSWTENTFRPIIDLPMPPLDHVLGINPVNYD